MVRPTSKTIGIPYIINKGGGGWCWGGEGRHYSGSRGLEKSSYRRTGVSSLEKVQRLGSFASFISHSAPFLPHRPAT